MKRVGLTKVRVVLTVILALLFIANIFLKLPAVEVVNRWLVIVVVLISLTGITGISRVIGFSLYLTGAGLLLYYHAPLDIWMEGVSRNTYVLVMFALAPLLSIPINQGGYTAALQNFLSRYLSRRSLFYVFVSTLTFFCGTILNVAAANLVYLIGSKQTYKLDYRLLVTGIVRGYSTTLIWGPTFAAVALPLELTGVSWLEFAPAALSIGVMLLIVGWLMAFIQERRDVQAAQPLDTAAPAPRPAMSPETARKDRKKLLELIIFWFVIFGLIVFISWWTHMNTINIVSIIALIIPPLWLGVIRRIKAYGRSLADYYVPQALPRMSPEIVMFSAAGFLSTAITYTGAAQWIPKAVDAITVSGSTLSFIAVTLGLIFFLSIFGIHGMVTVTVIGGAIDPAMYGLSPLVMSLILATGWAGSLPVSSSATVNIMMAGVIQKDPFTVGFKWNYRYALISFVLILLALEFMVRWGF